MQPLYFLLGIPVMGGAVLALVGHRNGARDVNVAYSLATSPFSSDRRAAFATATARRACSGVPSAGR